MRQIKISLVVGDKEWLERIASLIQSCQDLRLAWSAPTSKKALEMIDSSAVDIVIVDIHLTEDRYDGFKITQTIAANKKINTKVIMISGFHDENLIARAFLSGAVNYIFKENIDDLPDMIRYVFEKKPAYEVLIKYYQQTYQELLLSRLTPSEKYVYLLRKQGRSVTQIAVATQKAEGTVKNQLSRAGRKLRNPAPF